MYVLAGLAVLIIVPYVAWKLLEAVINLIDDMHEAKSIRDWESQTEEYRQKYSWKQPWSLLVKDCHNSDYEDPWAGY